MVSKEILCPHCKKPLPFGEGFQHDEELNFICSHCGKPVFGVTEKSEAEIKKVVSANLASGIHSQWNRKEPLAINITTMPDAAHGTEIETTTDDDLNGYSCFC